MEAEEAEEGFCGTHEVSACFPCTWVHVTIAGQCHKRNQEEHTAEITQTKQKP